MSSRSEFGRFASVGGVARREKLSAERRSEIARMGGIAVSKTVLSFCMNGCGVKPKALNLCARCLQNDWRRRKRERDGALR